MAHVSTAKKKVVSEFSSLIDKYDVVGTVNMENLPAKELSTMREKLRDSVVIKMTKQRLLNVALEKSKKEGVSNLKEKMKGMPAMIFTNSSPFTLFKILKKNKSTTAIKAGQIAPNDIVVPAGPTGFAPGPVIGELGQLGIKAGIDGGKVAIKQDTVVAKEGDEVSADLAGILSRLGIEPMEIGLDLVAVCENGDIITKEILDVDEEQYIADIQACSAQAFNLSVNAGIPTADTIETLLSKAVTEGKNLALNENILTDETAGDTLLKVHGQMLSLASQLSSDALDDELSAELQSAPAVASASSSSDDSSSTEATESPKDDDKKDDDNDDNASNPAEGLGALFG
ncbi:MAG: 50S ribosomal protein L10 [Nanobdellota archaeon]